MSEKNAEAPQQTNDYGFTTHEDFEGLFSKMPKQYALLKATIEKDGKILEPLTVWDSENILIDGYTRLRIHKELRFKEPPPIRRLSFDDKASTIAWAIQNQFNRRNLNAFQKAVYALDNKGSISKAAKARKLAGVRLEPNEGGDTLQLLADLAGVTRDALYKVEYILKASKADPANEELKKQIDALHKGETGVSINGVYEALKEAISNKKSTGDKKPKAKPIKKASSQAIEKKMNNSISSLDRLEQNLSQKNDRLYFYDRVINWAKAKKQAKKPKKRSSQ